MEAYNTFTYPVFEADQVLSQKELNMLVSHLEEQDRITRKNLTGIGIVCGLDLTFQTTTSVHIGCGTAITSLGFQINWKEKLFTHYQDYDLSDQFLQPDYTRELYLANIFKYATKYLPIKSSYELLPSDSPIGNKKSIPNDFFDDKVILLLLEVTLIDQKNCVTTNCDDKGKRMGFNIKPLVVPVSELTKELVFESPIPERYKKLSFPRYNVPFQNTVNAVQVLEGFAKAYDDASLAGIATAIQTVYEAHKNNLPATLAVLGNSKRTIINSVNNYKTTIYVQYLWDWIADIVASYNEIVAFRKINPALCCVDESLFPFHVVLGGDTPESVAYRTPFFATLNEKQKEDTQLKELILLFEKLALIITSFNIEKVANIKVTPSTYGNFPLAAKAIPFYYNQILELNKKWNPELTLKNENDTILSYHATIPNYTNKPEVKEPLLFDIEPYNFFRIEGHIGMSYQQALKKILEIQKLNQLPFNVIALNALDLEKSKLPLSFSDGDWSDMELDYDLVRRDWENVIGKNIEWIEANYDKTAPYFGHKSGNALNDFIRLLKKGRNSMVESFNDFLKLYTSFIITYEKIEDKATEIRKKTFNVLNSNDRENSVFTEDLIDHLDSIVMVCQKGEFRALYQAAEQRWGAICKQITFQYFIDKHHGLEHKAGVNKGGTFILVYKDNNILRNRTKKNTNETITNIDPSSKKARSSITKLNPNEEIIQTYQNSILNYASYYFPKDHYMQLSNLINTLQYQSSDDKDTIPNGIVFADFYIPYVCCSEGNSINFILPKGEIKIGDFNTLDFNSDDFNTKK